MKKPSETTARADHLPEALQDMQIVGEDTREELNIDSLIKVAGPRAGFSQEVFQKYMDLELACYPHCAYFALPSFNYRDIRKTYEEIQDCFRHKAIITFVAYATGKQWRLIILEKGKPILHYDPCLQTRHELNDDAKDLGDLFTDVYLTMHWPHQSNLIHSGPIVLFFIRHYISGKVHKLHQTAVNIHVTLFRRDVVRVLEKKYKLMLDGKPYTLPLDFRGVIHQPPLDIQCLIFDGQKSRIDANVMHHYMTYLLEKSSRHGFKIMEKIDKSTTKALFTEMTKRFEYSPVHVFYIVYHQAKHWKLFIIVKNIMNLHYDPMAPDSVSEFAKDLQKMHGNETTCPKWPSTSEKVDSGAYVLLAVTSHSVYRKIGPRFEGEDGFRERMIEEMRSSYGMMAHGEPYPKKM